MLISSPLSRVFMAAGIYLLLMWGYVVLPSAQLFAAFAALIMSVGLFFWVTDARELEAQAQKAAKRPEPVHVKFGPLEIEIENTRELSIAAANLKLEALKGDLARQYAQFGRDQSIMNSGGLGSWHQKTNSADNIRKRRGQS